MSKSRTATPPMSPRRPYPASATLLSGNGSSPTESDTQRYVRLESLIETLQRELDVQLKRIAELQAQLDRVIADRPLPPKR